MPDAALKLVPILAYLQPPSALALKGEFPDCKTLFTEICQATSASQKRVCEEFISLTRITALAWLVWICVACTVSSGLSIVGYHIWSNRDFAAPLVSSLALNGKQVLCMIGAVLCILLTAYYFVQLSCNQKAKNIGVIVREKREQNDMMQNTLAFIGVSLDSSHFDRKWVKYALQVLPATHDKLLVVFADDLLKYTRSVMYTGDLNQFDCIAAENHVDNRREQVEQFFKSEVGRLTEPIQSRVKLNRWSDFADANFVGLHRNIRIAYAALPEFRKAIDEVAIAHSQRQTSVMLEKGTLLDLNTSYIIEEIAMCIRITEIGGYVYEYHPSSDVPILPSLYDGTFAHLGLTISTLIGKKARRQFVVLNAP